FLFCIMFFFFFQAEDGIRDRTVTGVQTCALPISIAFEAWSWSPDGTKLAGIKHLAHGVHSGIGIYDFSSKTYDWVTDFGDWPLWLNDNRHVLFVSQGHIRLLDTATRAHHQVLMVTEDDVDIGSPGLARDNRTIYFTYVA